jgi:hypothetical protein
MNGENENDRLDKTIEHQLINWGALDTKAEILVGFVIASTAEILGFLILAVTEPAGQTMQPRPISSTLTYLVGAGLVLVAIGALLGISTLFPRKIWPAFEPGQDENMKRTALTTIEGKIFFKANLIRACGASVALGIVCLTLATLWLLRAVSSR